MSIKRDLTDEVIKYLNNIGYMPIVVPRSGIVPPTVYRHEEDTYIRIADLNDWLDARPELQALLSTKPESAVDLGNELNDRKAGKASISLFAQISAIFSAGAPNVEAAGEAGGEVQIMYDDCTTRVVVPDKVEKALAGVKPEQFGPALGEGKVHIAYEYLYASKVKASVKSNAGGSASASAAIAGVGKAEATASANRGASETMTWEGKAGQEPVAIAFKVAQVKLVGGHYQLNFGSGPGKALVAGAKGKPYISLTGQVYEIVEPGGLQSSRAR